MINQQLCMENSYLLSRLAEMRDRVRELEDEVAGLVAEIAAMLEVCEVAGRWQQAKLRYESGDEAAWEDARRELQALDEALCRLKEERQQ